MKTVDDVRHARTMLGFEVEKFLRSKDWQHTSSTPGCHWLWVKLVKWTTHEFPKKNGRWTKVKHEHLVMTDEDTALSIQSALDEDASPSGGSE